MPYILPESRNTLNHHIDELAEAIVKESGKNENYFAGLMNYAFTRTALKVVKSKYGRMHYWILAMLVGIFITIVLEIFRRLGGPYEDKQIKKNGDVDIIDEFLRDM